MSDRGPGEPGSAGGAPGWSPPPGWGPPAAPPTSGAPPGAPPFPPPAPPAQQWWSPVPTPAPRPTTGPPATPPSRGGSGGGAAVGLVILALVIGVSVIVVAKPWDGGRSSTSAAPSTPTTAGPGASSEPTADGGTTAPGSAPSVGGPLASTLSLLPTMEMVTRVTIWPAGTQPDGFWLEQRTEDARDSLSGGCTTSAPAEASASLWRLTPSGSTPNLPVAVHVVIARFDDPRIAQALVDQARDAEFQACWREAKHFDFDHAGLAGATTSDQVDVLDGYDDGSGLRYVAERSDPLGCEIHYDRFLNRYGPYLVRLSFTSCSVPLPDDARDTIARRILDQVRAAAGG